MMWISRNVLLNNVVRSIRMSFPLTWFRKLRSLRGRYQVHAFHPTHQVCRLTFVTWFVSRQERLILCRRGPILICLSNLVLSPLQLIIRMDMTKLCRLMNLRRRLIAMKLLTAFWNQAPLRYVRKNPMEETFWKRWLLPLIEHRITKAVRYRLIVRRLTFCPLLRYRSSRRKQKNVRYRLKNCLKVEKFRLSHVSLPFPINK